MVRVTATKPFWDTVEKTCRRAGDVFDATETRAAEIDGKLPGFVTVERVEAPNGRDDGLAGLSLQDLRALAKERGIKVPGRAGKEKIIELLGE